MNRLLLIAIGTAAFLSAFGYTVFDLAWWVRPTNEVRGGLMFVAHLVAIIIGAFNAAEHCLSQNSTKPFFSPE